MTKTNGCNGEIAVTHDNMRPDRAKPYSAIALAAVLLASPALAHAQGSAHKQPRAGQMEYTDEYEAWHKAHHALMKAVANPNRAKDKARDQYRRPVETLEFFAVTPDMKVAEYYPGGGWYSRVLGNYLGDNGRVVAIYPDANAAAFTPERGAAMRANAAKFAGDVAQWTGKDISHFAGMTTDAIPEGEKGSYDRVLLIRMLHNLNRWNISDSEIKAMRELLKDDGMLGIVQHRAREDAPFAYTDGSKGYLRQSDVIAFMEGNGFELVGVSEMNANPKDSADHASGVWEMPPVLRTKDENLAGLGESDRMTLLFRKRP